MDINRIEESLKRLFNAPLKEGENRKIIFWNDKDREFEEDIENLNLEDIIVHKMTESNLFMTKYLIEEEDTNRSYLIYTYLDLESEDNWLYDTVKYSEVFYADRLSMILNDLGIDTALRNVVKNYMKFFNSKERYAKFKALNIQGVTEQQIEVGIMSVLCNLRTADFEDVVRTVLVESIADDNKYLTLFEKFFDVQVFWKYIERVYDYSRELPSLKTFLMYLMATALSHQVESNKLKSINNFIAAYNGNNSYIFIDRWKQHKKDYVVYNSYARLIEKELSISEMLETLHIEDYKTADIFPVIDEKIISSICNGLAHDIIDYDEYTKLLKLRRSKHFYDVYENIYEALEYTLKIVHFADNNKVILENDVDRLYQAYTEKYYLMDTYYRKFYLAFDKDQHEILKTLQSIVEAKYTYEFMEGLNSKWSNIVSDELADNWNIAGVTPQRRFYSSYIASHIRKDERVFVIISDAMRYEIGKELAVKLEEVNHHSINVESMLSVLPSITKLGMAALLPNRQIDFDSKLNVTVDGMSSVSHERENILTQVSDNAMTIEAKRVLGMKKVERREYFKGKKLVYIYHNEIDAVGDHAASEDGTFEAAERAMDQLVSLVKLIKDDLSGTNIYITADHGFIYQREELPPSDKIQIDAINKLELKRRYMLSREDKQLEGQLKINLSHIIENEQQLNAYIPMGTMRNRIQGTGVNFVHGGASLQEVVVPVVTFKSKRVGQSLTSLIPKVKVALTNQSRKITNSIFNLEFFQTESVGYKYSGRTVMVYFKDENENIISNEEKIIADRETAVPANRLFRIQFALKNQSYDKDRKYYLCIVDNETELIVEQVSFSINLGFVNDFDF